MKLTQLKTAVLSIAGVTTEWVRSEFGDLRLKSTWQAAFDRTREFASVAAESAVDAAQFAYAVLAPCLWAMLWFGCLCYHAGEALAGWWHSEAEVVPPPALYPYQQQILKDIQSGQAGQAKIFYPTRPLRSYRDQVISAWIHRETCG